MRDVQTLAAERVTRREFIDLMWRPGPGEHVTFIAPTQNGKTTLAFELLDACATPRVPAMVLVMKPRDPTVTRWNKRLGFRLVRTWPPGQVRSLFEQKPRGWLLWPRMTKDVDANNYECWRQFKPALQDAYWSGNRIVFADELFGLTNILKLGTVIEAIYTQGAGMGVGLWAAVQKPTHVTRHAYSQAEHLFLGKDPDKDVRKRYAEIGGMDTEAILYNIGKLKKYEWLYIRRSPSDDDPEGRSPMCIIGRE